MSDNELEITSLKAGVGKVRITPPAGIPILGHPHRVSMGTHDDLWAKALVLENGGERVAILALDLAWPMSGGDYVKLREAVAVETGIKASHIMASTTHNHSGPAFRTDRRFKLPLKRQKDLIDPWIEELPARIAEAASKAVENMKDASLSFGRTLMTGLCYNRRKVIPEGVASLTNVSSSSRYYFGDTPVMTQSIKEHYVNWGVSPEEAGKYAPLGIPDGPIDPDLDVITIIDREGKPFAVLANYACQPVTCAPPMPYLISADFPGFMTNLIEEATGAICLFTAGACGDVRPYRSTPIFAEPERIGFVLASGVLKAMKEAKPITNAYLRVIREIVEVNLRDYPSIKEVEREIAEKKNLFKKARAEGNFREARRIEQEIAPLEFAKGPCEIESEDPGLVGWIGQKGTLLMEIQAISIGDIILLSIPNEVNVSIGLEIKQSSWTDKLLLCTYTNGFYWYLLKKEEYEEGGYEAAGSRLAPGSGEKVITAASALVERLK